MHILHRGRGLLSVEQFSFADSIFSIARVLFLLHPAMTGEERGDVRRVRGRRKQDLHSELRYSAVEMSLRVGLAEYA